MNNEKLTLREMVTQTLQANAPQRFTSNELAKKIIDDFPKWCSEKIANSKQDLTSYQSLASQLQSEIGAGYVKEWQKRNHYLQTLEEKPRKYFYDVVEIEEDQEIEDENNDLLNEEFTLINPLVSFNKNQGKTNKKEDLSEHDLYPLLSKYLGAEYATEKNNKKEFNFHSIRIDEKKSSNLRGRGGNKWLFPDVAGFEIIGANWRPEIKKCAETYLANKCKLWSFEVKKEINLNNVREVFFQTVSNSSWANYAYLVANAIIDKKTIDELQILASLHGIGVIRLNRENPTEESEILIPAKEKNVNWDNANRLAEENKDFRKYINVVVQINNDLKFEDLNTKDWLPSE